MERKIFWISFTVLGLGGGFCFAAVVGVGGNHPDCVRELVDRVSERLVLSGNVTSNISVANKAAAGLLASSSNGDGPIAIDPDIGGHNLQLLL